MCLLAEVAYEHDEALRAHLPLLFHSMAVVLDAGEAIVFRHAQQVILNLLYSLSARHLELRRTSGEIQSYGISKRSSILASLSNASKRGCLTKIQLSLAVVTVAAVIRKRSPCG